MNRRAVPTISPPWSRILSSGRHGLHLPLVLLLPFLTQSLCSAHGLMGFDTVVRRDMDVIDPHQIPTRGLCNQTVAICPPPPEPENGGFLCHPPHCEQPLTSGSVIEYFCAEGYMLKGDYKFLTCRDGTWNPPMGVSCRLSQDTNKHTSLEIPTLSIVASTASSVALILLLIVLFVLLQPKLKSFHHSRREACAPGEPVSIMVDGVQVALPSYEEAVYGSAGNCIPSASSRVQIVLSEGPGEEQDLQQSACSSNHAGQNLGSDVTGHTVGHTMQGTSSSSQRSETVLVHQASPSWVSGAVSRTPTGKGADSDVQSLLSLSSGDYTDDIPLLKEA